MALVMALAWKSWYFLYFWYIRKFSFTYTKPCIFLLTYKLSKWLLDHSWNSFRSLLFRHLLGTNSKCMLSQLSIVFFTKIYTKLTYTCHIQLTSSFQHNNVCVWVSEWVYIFQRTICKWRTNTLRLKHLDYLNHL